MTDTKTLLESLSRRIGQHGLHMMSGGHDGRGIGDAEWMRIASEIDTARTCYEGLVTELGEQRRLSAWLHRQLEALESTLPDDWKPKGCGCSLRGRLVGDGCAVCNPALAAEFAAKVEGR